MRFDVRNGGDNMKFIVFSIVSIVFAFVMGTGAVVYAQTATPTTQVSPSPTSVTTTTPSPTGEVLGATIPSGAPATGMGGK